MYLPPWSDGLPMTCAVAQIEYVLRQALVKQGRVKLVEKVVVEVEEIDSTQKDN